MIDTLWAFALDFARRLVLDLIWDTLLFQLGRCSLWLLTLGHHPRRQTQERHADWISAAGLLPVIALWLLLAGWNHRHG